MRVREKYRHSGAGDTGARASRPPAAGRGDRTRFREALARAKATLAGYPAGGERTAAAAAVRAWDDIDRLWTYQIESPTGAFFDQSSDVYRIVSTYPGYEEAIRRQT